MGVRLVNPETLVRPVGYSHAAIGEGRAVVLAGQIGCDQSGKVEAPDELVPQFAKALDNLLEALRACGGEPADLAHLRIFVTDVAAYREKLRALGEAWRARFGTHYPPMTLAGVQALFEPGTVVELEGLAYVG
ncbi:MAG: RidA family protein [Planctomycetota bacterium]|jgi:enamine deaminase RidA (YjgF/YER057c/UK114 family)|nr:RidA family protein [Planctomycetota bacterium]